NLSILRQGKEATLAEDLGDLDLTCTVDPFRLGQVFRNILENALAAAPNHAEVKVTCSQTKINDEAAISVSFRDNGPGLTSEQRQRIFDPFFTTKTKGTGLGMAIAKRIVEAHGGKIEVGGSGVRPEPGGAEIIVTIP